MPTIYRGYSESDDTVGEIAVLVVENGTTRPLAHQVKHSPTGFNWGYMGSGPADLARSILADHLGRIPHPAIYQRFKEMFVGRLPQGGAWEVTADEVDAYLFGMNRHPHWWSCPECGGDVPPSWRVDASDAQLETDGWQCETPKHYTPVAGRRR